MARGLFFKIFDFFLNIFSSSSSFPQFQSFVLRGVRAFNCCFFFFTRHFLTSLTFLSGELMFVFIWLFVSACLFWGEGFTTQFFFLSVSRQVHLILLISADFIFIQFSSIHSSVSSLFLLLLLLLSQNGLFRFKLSLNSKKLGKRFATCLKLIAFDCSCCCCVFNVVAF